MIADTPASAVTASVSERLNGRTLLVDMRICQLWRERGIPRYVQSLLLTMAQQAPGLKFVFLYERENPNPLRHDALSAMGPIVFDDGEDVPRNLPFIDAFLVSTFFLPPPQQHIIEYLLPPLLLRDRPSIFGIVYDFIPKLFPDIYLPGQVEQRNYASCVEAMRRCAHLFAISETTRIDGVELLGLDPTRITNVYGSIDEGKWASAVAQGPPAPGTPQDYPFGALMCGGYYLYVSGDDWRKNMDGLIRGHALARAQSGAGTFPPLVIACSMHPSRREHFYEIGRQAGLRRGRDLILTGELTDDDLVRLIQGALATVYPSLYEGLGLPILESYACATAAIGSDTSSVRELIHPECMFDPRSDDDIARALLRIKDNPQLRQASIAFGNGVRERINWDNTTGVVLERMADALDNRPVKSNQAALDRTQAVGVFSALPPAETGIARFTRDTLNNAPWTSHIFAKFESVDDLITINRELANGADKPEAQRSTVALPVHAFDLMSQRVGYGKRVYVLGNSVHHLPTLAAAMRFGRDRDVDNYLYLHEANNAGLWLSYSQLDFGALKALFATHYPAIHNSIMAASGMDSLFQLRCYGIRPIVHLTGIRRIIVNSEVCRTMVLDDLDHDPDVAVDVAFHPFLDKQPAALGRQPRPDADIVVGHFGTVGPHKHIVLLGEVCRLIAKKHSVALVLAGFDVTRSMAEHHMPVYQFHHLVDSPSAQDLLRWMNTVDVAVQLRYPYFGESSGCVNQLVALDQKVIATRDSISPGLRSMVTDVAPDISAAELAEAILRVARGPRTGHSNELGETYSVQRYQQRLAAILNIDLPQFAYSVPITGEATGPDDASRGVQVTGTI